MAESEMVVRRLASTPDRLHSLLLSPAKFDRMRDELIDLPDDVGVYLADLDLMEQIAGFHIHRGVLAAGWRPVEQELVFERLLERVPASGPFTVLAAQGINNADNMGGLFRTGAGLGVDAILLGDRCCDPLYRKAIRVSMGHVLGVPWVVHAPLAGALLTLRDECGCSIVAAESCPGASPLDDLTSSSRMVIVVGSEGDGLTQDVLEVAHQVIEIPMADGVPSLNVVVAAGIMLWQARR